MFSGRRQMMLETANRRCSYIITKADRKYILHAALHSIRILDSFMYSFGLHLHGTVRIQFTWLLPSAPHQHITITNARSSSYDDSQPYSFRRALVESMHFSMKTGPRFESPKRKRFLHSSTGSVSVKPLFVSTPWRSVTIM